MSSPGARLRWARAEAGYATARDAARALRIGEVSYRAYENDQHGYSKHAVKFSKAFGVPVEWLLDGGAIPLGVSDAAAERRLVEDLGAHGIEMVRKVDITYAMGDGSVVDDYPETELVPFSLDFLRRFARGTTDRLFIATGIGDSMEPTLRRDDLVMIDSSQTILGMQDQIWALSYAGTGMIKRVRKLTGGRVQLLSDNPSIPPLEVSEDELYVVGKVVWTARVM